jgi:hypothetical protein
MTQTSNGGFMEDSPTDIIPAGGRASWVSPVLHRRGTLRSLTRAYLQGGGGGGGPPATSKYIGSKDMARSSQGT